MKTKECPACAVEADADAEVCPICGYEFPRRSRSIQIMAWIMVILILFWLVF